VQLSDVVMTSIKVHIITIQAHESVHKSPNHLALVASAVHHIYSTLKMCILEFQVRAQVVHIIIFLAIFLGLTIHHGSNINN
jgi:hypothetical protein